MLIAQISDPHIRPQGELYQGVVDSNRQFQAAIECLNALNPQPDLVLLSGDIVDEGSVAEYVMARRLLAALNAPLRLIPGNHDDRETFRASFADHTYLPSSGPLHFIVEDMGPIRVIALDVTVPDLHHGEMDDAASVWLEAALAREPARPTIIMMHQPPFLSGIPYIDTYCCFGGDRLAEIVARYPAVERIACGHIHRFMQLRFGGTSLCTAPSTTTAIALQLQPDAAAASYLEPPALLLHHWRPQIGLVTHLLPIGGFPGPFAFA